MPVQLRRSSLTCDRQPAPLATELLNATAPEAEGFFYEAEAVKSNETENPIELRGWHSSVAQ